MLDIMQTIPSFVYLIPVVMLFGVGLTPGVVATIIFALPPIIRLTNLGIRQVGKGFVGVMYVRIEGKRNSKRGERNFTEAEAF